MIEKPEESGKDNAHFGARVVLSAIPYIGGPALEIFNKIIVPPIEIRKQKWMSEVTDALNLEDNKYIL